MQNKLCCLTLIVGWVIGYGFAAAQQAHHHDATHGGQVRELGVYHVEFVVEEHGEIAVYLLDGDLKPLTVKNVEGFISLKVGSKYKKVDLKRSADAGHLQAEVDLHKMHEFEVGVRLTIEGREYSNIVFKYSAHDKQLKKIFPNAHGFDAKHANLSTRQIAAIEKELVGYDANNTKVAAPEKEVQLFIAEDNAHKTIGAALMLSVIGPDKAQIQGWVGIDTAGKVIRVVLMEHHHDSDRDEAEHGEHREHGEDHHDLEYAAFLKQFVGKTAASDLRIGKEVEAGDKMVASTAVATGVKKALLVWNVAKDHLHTH